MDCSLQSSQSMEFSKQEHWSGLPFPSPGDHPDPVIASVSPMAPVLADSLLEKPLFQYKTKSSKVKKKIIKVLQEVT